MAPWFQRQKQTSTVPELMLSPHTGEEKCTRSHSFSLFEEKRRLIFSPALLRMRDPSSQTPPPPVGPKVSSLRSRLKLPGSNSSISSGSSGSFETATVVWLRRGEDSQAARRLRQGALGPWNSGPKSSLGGRDEGSGGSGTPRSLCSGYSSYRL